MLSSIGAVLSEAIFQLVKPSRNVHLQAIKIYFKKRKITPVFIFR